MAKSGNHSPSIRLQKSNALGSDNESDGAGSDASYDLVPTSR